MSEAEHPRAWSGSIRRRPGWAGAAAAAGGASRRRRARRSPTRVRDRPDQGPGHPAGVAGRVDLPGSRRAHPGRRHRRGGPPAVPLPRGMAARPGTRRSTTACSCLGRRLAEVRDRRSSGGSRSPASAGTGCWPPGCGCSTSGCSGPAARSTPPATTTRTARSASPRCAASTCTLKRGAVLFAYPAKGGIPRTLALRDPLLHRVVNSLLRRRGGGEDLLAYRLGRGLARRAGRGPQRGGQGAGRRAVHLQGPADLERHGAGRGHAGRRGGSGRGAGKASAPASGW